MYAKCTPHPLYHPRIMLLVSVIGSVFNFISTYNFYRISNTQGGNLPMPAILFPNFFLWSIIKFLLHISTVRHGHLNYLATSLKINAKGMVFEPRCKYWHGHIQKSCDQQFEINWSCVTADPPTSSSTHTHTPCTINILLVCSCQA